jgi:hypothetical protein
MKWARWKSATAGALMFGALLCSTAGADESIFSLTFLGFREESSDGRSQAMGVLGVGLGDEKTALTPNPGSFGRIDRMTLSLVGGASIRNSSDGTIEESESDATFPQLRAALPLPGQFVFSAGFIGLRNFRGEFVLPKEYVGPISYNHAFERSGSLYEVPLGLARSVNSRLHLGVTLDIVLGTVDEAWTTGGDSLVSLRTHRRDEMDGVTLTLGAIGDLLPWLRLGLAWSPGVDLDVDTRTTIEDGRIADTSHPFRTTRSQSKASYPSTLQAGTAVRLGSKWLVSADGLRRDWSGWDGRLYGAPRVGTEWRVGGGIEARPHKSPRGRPFAYRVGVSESQWPQTMGSDVLREVSVHGGIGYDLRDGLGRLDGVVSYTRAGSLDRNGLEESRWSFLLSLTGQETWRRKSPRK